MVWSASGKSDYVNQAEVGLASRCGEIGGGPYRSAVACPVWLVSVLKTALSRFRQSANVLGKMAPCHRLDTA